MFHDFTANLFGFIAGIWRERHVSHVREITKRERSCQTSKYIRQLGWNVDGYFGRKLRPATAMTTAVRNELTLWLPLAAELAKSAMQGHDSQVRHQLGRPE